MKLELGWTHHPLTSFHSAERCYAGWVGRVGRQWSCPAVDPMEYNTNQAGKTGTDSVNHALLNLRPAMVEGIHARYKPVQKPME